MADLASFIPDEKKPIAAKIKSETASFLAGDLVMHPTEWKGYRFIPYFQAETAKYAYDNFDMGENAVVVVSYPKTGTNWSGEVIRLILYGDDEKLSAISKAVPPPLVMLEMASAEKFKLYEHIPLPRKLFWTHLPEELFNIERLKKKHGKVIVVIRNPKDQAVSWYHFVQAPSLKVIRDVASSDWSEFLESYMSGKQPTISKDGQWYPDHIAGWCKHKNDPDVLFVYFEDMKRDLQKEIRKMAKFLNVKLTDERVEKIAEMTTFSKMKKQSESKGSATESLRSTMKLMRKGQVGEWKEKFTVAQSEVMDQLMEEKLAKHDIKFTYEL